MSFRFFSVYENGVIFKLAECPSKCVFPKVSPNAFRLFSECFQYGFRMLSEQTEYFPHVDFERFPFQTLSVYCLNAFRTRRIDLEWTELFPHAFQTFSAYSDVRPNALRTAHITGIFQIASILQGKTQTSILDYIFGLFYLSMPPKRRAGSKGETGEKDGRKGKKKQLPPK